MPGRAVLDVTVLVDPDDAHRGTAGARERGREPVEEFQRLADPGPGPQLGEQHAAQLPHGDGRARAVADDVTDHQQQRAVGPGHGVEPVAAGGLLGGGEHVPGRHVEPGQHRHGVGQQGPLHGLDAAPGDRVPRPQFGQLGLGGLPLQHPPGDVLTRHDGAPRLPVRARPGGEDHVDVHLGHGAVGLGQLHPGLAQGHRLPGGRRRAVRLRPSLAHQRLGEVLQMRLPVRDAVPGQLPGGGVEGHRRQLGPLGHDRDERQVLERLGRRLYVTEHAYVMVVGQLSASRCRPCPGARLRWSVPATLARGRAARSRA